MNRRLTPYLMTAVTLSVMTVTAVVLWVWAGAIETSRELAAYVSGFLTCLIVDLCGWFFRGFYTRLMRRPGPPLYRRDRALMADLDTNQALEDQQAALLKTRGLLVDADDFQAVVDTILQLRRRRAVIMRQLGWHRQADQLDVDTAWRERLPKMQPWPTSHIPKG
jgi:hypothetical protein